MYVCRRVRATALASVCDLFDHNVWIGHYTCLDTIHAIDANLCAMVLLTELYPAIPLPGTLTLLSSNGDVKQLKLQVVFWGKFSLDQIQLSITEKYEHHSRYLCSDFGVHSNEQLMRHQTRQTPVSYTHLTLPTRRTV